MYEVNGTSDQVIKLIALLILIFFQLTSELHVGNNNFLTDATQNCGVFKQTSIGTPICHRRQEL